MAEENEQTKQKIWTILGGGSTGFITETVSFEGEGAMIMATLFYALSVCCIKIFAEKEDPVVLSGLFCPIPLFLL